MSTPPVFHLIGGPNGAGKTTFAKEYLPNEANCLRFHNSDEIASGISPFNPAAAQTKAAHILLESLKESITRKETFALESTLSGKTYARYLNLAKASGFTIHLHYLDLPSADESWPEFRSVLTKEIILSPKTPSTDASLGAETIFPTSTFP